VQFVALAQPGEEGHDVVLTDLPDRRTPPRDEDVDVTAQVTAVGAESVRGQPALDREVVEVRADLGPQRWSDLITGGGYQRGTSSRRLVGAGGARPTYP
jgi:hypothetical protein